MTQQQKLTKVIERAVERGYGWKYDELPIWRDASRKIYVVDREGYNQPLTTKDTEFYKLIFSHDFAKAYWDEEMEYQTRVWTGNFPLVHVKKGEVQEKPRWVAETSKTERWQTHLQSAVLSKDPIDYYFKNK